MDYASLLSVALEEARRGLAEGGIPVGAALFDRSGKLLGRGHNRRVQDGDPSAHGETDAFRNAGRQRSYRDKILATTLAPCWYCSGLDPAVSDRHGRRRRVDQLRGRHRVAPRERSGGDRPGFRSLREASRGLRPREPRRLEGGHRGISSKVQSSMFKVEVQGLLNRYIRSDIETQGVPAFGPV